MIPVVDSCIDFSMPPTGDGSNGIEVLADFLRQTRSVHVLRAVQASVSVVEGDAGDSGAVLGQMRAATALATTPGSGGLPNALVATVDPGSDELEQLFDDEALQGRLRAIHVRQATVGKPARDRLARLAKLDVGLEVDSADALLSVSVLQAGLSVLVRLAPSVEAGEDVANARATNDADGADNAVESVTDAVRRIARSGDCVAINVIGLGVSSANQTVDMPSVESLRRTVDRAVDAVGVERVLLSSGHALRCDPSRHEAIWSRLTAAIEHRPASERDRLLRQNAINWYRL